MFIHLIIEHIFIAHSLYSWYSSRALGIGKRVFSNMPTVKYL